MSKGRTRRRRTGRRTRMSPDEIRETLLGHALRLFREEGYDATSVSRLTREAGVAKGTFFNHFPTKEHVLAEFAAHAWSDALDETLGEDHRGTDAIIHQLDGLVRRLEAHDALGSVLADRLPGLPLPRRLAEEPSTPETEPDHDTPAPRLLEYWTTWIRSRIDESLPIAVPLQPVENPDLAALLCAALTTTLLGVVPESAGSPTPPAPITLGRRAVFLLRSAGFVAPDPPAPSPPDRRGDREKGTRG